MTESLDRYFGGHVIAYFNRNQDIEEGIEAGLSCRTCRQPFTLSTIRNEILCECACKCRCDRIRQERRLIAHDTFNERYPKRKEKGAHLWAYGYK